MNYGITKATPEQVAQAMELKNGGASWSEIARRLGCAHRGTWQRWVKKAEARGFYAWAEPVSAKRDINWPIAMVSHSEVAKAMELRQEGVCWDTIAMILGGVHAVTWRSYVLRASLLGFAAWGGRYDSRI